MPNLGNLALKRTELHHKYRQYRRKFTATCLKLSNLDDRPIKEKDRLYAIAWMKGGKEGEMEERRRLRKIENDKRYESMMKNEAAREEFKQKTDLKRTELGKEYDV